MLDPLSLLEAHMSRWSIVAGYYAFYELNHGGQGSLEYRRLCKIQTYYRPGLLGVTSLLTDPDIRTVFNALAERHHVAPWP